MIVMFILPFSREFDIAEMQQNIQGIDIDDPNFDPTLSLVQEESPYAEVRSAVANPDDPTIPASTLRAWVVGLVWAILLSGVNQFFPFRDLGLFIPAVCLPRHLSRFLFINSTLKDRCCVVNFAYLQSMGPLYAKHFYSRSPAQPGAI
jgi:hypothetical protein